MSKGLLACSEPPDTPRPPSASAEGLCTEYPGSHKSHKGRPTSEARIYQCACVRDPIRT